MKEDQMVRLECLRLSNGAYNLDEILARAKRFEEFVLGATKDLSPQSQRPDNLNRKERRKLEKQKGADKDIFE